MPSIQTYLQQILDAVYGEEVRGAIHDAIEECYTDVTTSATAADAAATAANAAADAANAAASGFINIPESLFRVPGQIETVGPPSGTDSHDICIANGGINPTTGLNLSFDSNPLTCKTYFMTNSGPLLFVMSTTDYEMTAWNYRTASATNRVSSLSNKAYTNASIVVPFTSTAPRFRVGFRRVKDDGVTRLTTELINTELLPNLHIFAITDESGDYGAGVPADSGVVQALSAKVDQLTLDEGVTNALGWKTVQILDTNVAPAVSALTVIDDTLFRFPYVSQNQSGTGTKYQISSDGTLTRIGTFSTNIGHTNTADFCAANHCLIVPRQKASDDVTDFALYVFHNVDASTDNFDIGDQTENKVTKIDFSNVQSVVGDTGINAVWAGDDFGKNDYIWLISRVTNDGATIGKISLVQLGMGNKNLGNVDTFVSKPSGIFNGSFKIHKTFDRPWVTTTEGCNDACTFAGNIIEVNTITSRVGISLMVHSFGKFFNDVRTERIYIPRNNDSGAGATREYEGIAVKNGYIYIGGVSGNIYVFDMNPYRNLRMSVSGTTIVIS